MIPRQTLINPVAHSAVHLRPFQQGQLDALCGIYCTLNALQIAAYPAWPLGLSKAQSLFTSAISMMRKHHAHLNPVSQGMANERMIWLAHHIAKSASTKRMQFLVEALDSEDIRGWIEDSLNLGAPVVACLIDREHFSVIIDITLGGLVLFDSQDTSWLPVNRKTPLTNVIDRKGMIRVRLNAPT